MIQVLALPDCLTRQLRFVRELDRLKDELRRMAPIEDGAPGLWPAALDAVERATMAGQLQRESAARATPPASMA